MTIDGIVVDHSTIRVVSESGGYWRVAVDGTWGCWEDVHTIFGPVVKSYAAAMRIAQTIRKRKDGTYSSMAVAGRYVHPILREAKKRKRKAVKS